MNFVHVDAGEPKQWPIASTDVWRYAPENASFPQDCAGADLSAFGFEPLGDTARPDFDPATQRVREVAPVKQDGAWVRAWQVVKLSQDEIDAVIQSKRRLIDKAIILDRITDEQLTRALSIMTQRQKERWRMPSKPRIYVDDPDLLSLLQAVGADPAVILAA